MALDQAGVLDALKVVVDPDLHRDIVSLGFIKDLDINAGKVSFSIELTTPACPVKDQMRDQARAAVMALPGVSDVAVNMTASVRATGIGGEGPRAPVAGVKRSEEHTSELQSLRHLVCRLLLEKKKQHN